MKVVCINSRVYVKYNKLTVGKIYEVLDIHKFEDKKEAFYTIVNDIGVRYWYQVELFVSLKESRKDKISKINESR